MTPLVALPEFPDDDLPMRNVKAYADQKYRPLWYYDKLFTDATRKKWPTRVYIDLLAGPGFGRLGKNGRIVAASPLLALMVTHPFDKYIFGEADPSALEALKKRVARITPTIDPVFIDGDVHERIDDIRAEIPPHGKGGGVLTFCFADLQSTDFPFETIRRLAEGKLIDFLTLIPTAMDAKRNFQQNYLKPGSRRIDDFLGRTGWRESWEKNGGRNVPFFLAKEYAASMRGIGYRLTEPDTMVAVVRRENNMELYNLALFSKSGLAHRLWASVLEYAPEQIPLL